MPDKCPKCGGDWGFGPDPPFVWCKKCNYEPPLTDGLPPWEDDVEPFKHRACPEDFKHWKFEECPFDTNACQDDGCALHPDYVTCGDCREKDRQLELWRIHDRELETRVVEACRRCQREWEERFLQTPCEIHMSMDHYNDDEHTTTSWMGMWTYEVPNECMSHGDEPPIEIDKKEIHAKFPELYKDLEELAKRPSYGTLEKELETCRTNLESKTQGLDYMTKLRDDILDTANEQSDIIDCLLMLLKESNVPPKKYRKYDHIG